MIIDSHQHFWIYDPDRDTWIDDTMTLIRKDFLPVDLSPIYSKNNISGCVAVQADQSEQETKFLLQLASENDFIKGVVGWLDLSSHYLEESLEKYAREVKLKGLRHIVQSEPEGFMLQKEFLEGISQLAKFHLTYDILIFPHQLQEAKEMVNQFPQQKFVIDHLAKPYIESGKIDQWSDDIKSIAAYENVYCKLSGMVTEADWQNWNKEEFFPYLEVAYQAFGEERLMYGSDWPVCLLGGEYEDILDIIHSYLSKYGNSSREKIMRGNAINFYNLSH